MRIVILFFSDGVEVVCRSVVWFLREGVISDWLLLNESILGKYRFGSHG